MIVSSQKDNTRVIFSLVVGGYDKIANVSHIKGWDKVMFTDLGYNERLKNRRKGWTFIKVDKSLVKTNPQEFLPRGEEHYKNTIINRYYKLNPHKVLSDAYEESLYIDGSIKKFNIKEIENRIKYLKEKNKPLAVAVHAFRNNVYDEMEEIKRCEMLTEENLQKIKRFFKEKGFPDKSGLYNNAIIWRKHKEEKVIQMMEEWWDIVYNYCMRDQVSLPYIIWKFNYIIEPLFEKGYSAENHPAIHYEYKHPGLLSSNLAKKRGNRLESVILQKLIAKFHKIFF